MRESGLAYKRMCATTTVPTPSRFSARCCTTKTQPPIRLRESAAPDEGYALIGDHTRFRGHRRIRTKQQTDAAIHAVSVCCLICICQRLRLFTAPGQPVLHCFGKITISLARAAHKRALHYHESSCHQYKAKQKVDPLNHFPGGQVVKGYCRDQQLHFRSDQPRGVWIRHSKQFYPG